AAGTGRTRGPPTAASSWGATRTVHATDSPRATCGRRSSRTSLAGSRCSVESAPVSAAPVSANTASGASRAAGTSNVVRAISKPSVARGAVARDRARLQPVEAPPHVEGKRAAREGPGVVDLDANDVALAPDGARGERAPVVRGHDDGRVDDRRRVHVGEADPVQGPA